MKHLSIFLLILIFNFSCIDKGQCTKDYLEADEWLSIRTKSCGDNIECQKTTYKNYLEKYAKIKSECE